MGIGAAVMVGAMAGGVPVMAPAATDLPRDPQDLLSEDGFGTCVPEEHLDDIWLVMAKGRKLDRVPHVCMAGTCEDLPDIATWARAQQFPDDIDLTRTEVVSRYADFVEAFCTPAAEDSAEAPTEELADEDVPPVLLFVPDTPGAGALLTPPADLPPLALPSRPPGPLSPLRPPTPFPASWPPAFPSSPFAPPPGAGVPPGTVPAGETGQPPGNGGPPPNGTPPNGVPPNGTPPVAWVIPLPPALWMMLAALGVLAGLGRVRRVPAAGR